MWAIETAGIRIGTVIFFQYNRKYVALSLDGGREKFKTRKAAVNWVRAQYQQSTGAA